jgi:hypothetical protein
MGGTNDPENLVRLTPEEHFLIHTLLIKIYPNNTNLIFAVKMMCEHDSSNRMTNKMYGWLKKRHSDVSSKKFKRMWADEQKKKQIVESMRKSFNEPEHRKQKSEIMTQEWKQNREHRLKQIQKLQQEYNAHVANIVRDKWKNDEVYKQKMANRKKRGPDGTKMKAKWADPIWKSKVLEDRRLAKERKKKNEAHKNN